MNHKFQSSLIDANKCITCKREELDHTDRATCDACSNTGSMEIYIDMLMCPSCIEKELELQKESKNNTENRVLDMNSLITKSREIDASVTLSQDLFNAETIAITELKTAIESDSSITNKQFKLAELVTERMNLFKKAIFEKNQELIELNNKQRASQTYLNNLANQLRADEREKLKLQDMSYQPQSPKDKKPRTDAAKKKALDVPRLKQLAAELGLPHTVLQMMCVSKNLTPEQAYDHMKKAMGK